MTVLRNQIGQKQLPPAWLLCFRDPLAIVLVECEIGSYVFSDTPLAVLRAHPVGRLRTQQPDIDCQKSDHHRRQERGAPSPYSHDERHDRAGKRGTDAPGRAIEAEDEAAQSRGPGLRNQHRADRPFAVQREADNGVGRNESTPCRRQRDQRHRQREHCNVERQDIAPAKPVCQPRPEIKPNDADQRGELHPAAVGAEIDGELLHQHAAPPVPGSRRPCRQIPSRAHWPMRCANASR